MRQVVIVDAVRTPIGRYGGVLSDARPDDLGAVVIRALLDRNPGIDPAEVEDVIFGAANQAGEDNRNVARMSALLGGLPISVGGVTVNRLCGSGLEAVNQAARAIMLGDGEVYIAGGLESMTRAPFVMAKNGAAWERKAEIYDTTMGWRFINPTLSKMHHPFIMGETAENVAESYSISRDEQDRFALQSQQRAIAAQSGGRFANEIVPVTLPQRKGDPVTVEIDEHPRPDATLEKMGKLPTIFRKNGTVTAGNSSGINDGSAALMLMSEARAKALGLTPLAYIRSMAVAGVEPAYMGLGPVPAARKALQRAGLGMGDIGLVELNEAFAAQALACMRDLELDPETVNVNGGAIALGHPLGCSGARILTTLVHDMQTRNVRFGLATMCIGVGQGIASIVERA